MRFKAVIFDLDGVLCHTDKYHYMAWKEIADSLGIPFDETINNRLRGISRMESLEIVLEAYPSELTKDEKTRLAERKNIHYRNLLRDMSPEDISAETLSVLDALKARAILLAIGSSSKNASLILEKTNILSRFDAVSDGNGLKRSKPDPEVFLRAAGLLGIEPADCLVVEDAESGVIAAQLAGMKCAGMGIAANCGKADYILDSMSDLIRIVEGL